MEKLHMGHQVMTSFSFETIGDRKVRKVFLTNQHSCEVKQYKAGLLLTLKRQLHLTKKNAENFIPGDMALLAPPLCEPHASQVQS